MKLHLPITDQDWKQGDENAAVKLLEYGDYECPYSGRAYWVVKELQQYFGDKLLFVFRNFPLTELHPHALNAAHAAEAAGLQGKFWPMHDILFENRKRLLRRHIFDYARTIGAIPETLVYDMDEAVVSEKVNNDIGGGELSGVHGTPTFFINNERYHGHFHFENLRDEILKVLADTEDHPN